MTEEEVSHLRKENTELKEALARKEQRIEELEGLLMSALLRIEELNASRQALRNNDTMGKNMRKIEEKEGTHDSPNHCTAIRWNNPC